MLTERRSFLKQLALWLGLIVAGLAVLSAIASGSIKLLDLSTKPEVEAIRSDLTIKIETVEQKSDMHDEKHDAALQTIPVMQNDVHWIKEALKDAGYRAPKVKELP